MKSSATQLGRKSRNNDALVSPFVHTNNFYDFWPASLRPPSSPDLNPLDYSVWSVVERQACRTSHRNVSDLKDSIIATWNNLSNDYICKTYLWCLPQSC